MKNIVILGGGFAGVRTALTLKNKIKKQDFHAILIDKNSFHTFTPSLYEVATGEESGKNVVIPFKTILADSLEFIQGEVEKIDTTAQEVLLDKNREYSYDFLILALGSETADFGIHGIKEYGIPLKTLEDAMKIKKALIDAKKIVIGGGGFSGTELACELATNRGHLDITLIQGAPVLLEELGDKVSQLAKKRLEKGNVHLVLGKRIKKVTKENVEIETGETFPYDLFVWTGGVRSNNLLGKIEVDETLAVKNLKNVFAIGDCVFPGVALRAEQMGEVVAKNILRLIEGEHLLSYKYYHMGYIVPLGGRFATFVIGKYHISGIIAYILQQLVFLRYLLMIVPFIEAFRRFIKFEKDLNDNSKN